MVFLVVQAVLQFISTVWTKFEDRHALLALAEQIL